MIDRHLESVILRQRGDNRPLVRELLEKLTPEAKDRLFRIITELEAERAAERRMRRQGRFF